MNNIFRTGQPLGVLGWNSAKVLGDEGMTGTGFRIEAIGHDWVVIRGDDFHTTAASATFENGDDLMDFLNHFGD